MKSEHNFDLLPRILGLAMADQSSHRYTDPLFVLLRSALQSFTSHRTMVMNAVHVEQHVMAKETSRTIP